MSECELCRQKVNELSAIFIKKQYGEDYGQMKLVCQKCKGKLKPYEPLRSDR